MENVGQGDSTKFELLVLHGEDLQRLFGQSKVHTHYVEIQAADRARLQRLEGGAPKVAQPVEMAVRVELTPTVRRQVGRGRRSAKPILDTETGKEYRSEYQAGRDLYWLVGGDIKDTHVWFKIARMFPDRFRTKNADGEWVALHGPSAPTGSPHP